MDTTIFSEIPKYNEWQLIEEINKGWSSDKKYYIETTHNQKILLRTSDISQYNRKKEEFELLNIVSNLDIIISVPLDFGMCSNNELVYTIFTWVEGFDAEQEIGKLDTETQYKLGVTTGKYLKQIHSIPAPINQQPWDERFNAKIDRNIKLYLNCGITVKSYDKVIEYINNNRYLLNNRPQCLQHGDYHIGNMVVDEYANIGIIDFNRFDYGDPYEEFNRIIWSAQVSPLFASGQLHGYFGNNVPDDFFKLLVLYMASNDLCSIPWAIPFGEKEVNTMIRNHNIFLEMYDDFNTYIPSWYQKSSEL
ncbi:MAG: aph [Clostridiales bacterium]|jgi:aminoglycoside phosphotransferase (APT) family kinase protein|nr:aph [Clostridiales bacterium]